MFITSLITLVFLPTPFYGRGCTHHSRTSFGFPQLVMVCDKRICTGEGGILAGQFIKAPKFLQKKISRKIESSPKTAYQ